MSVFARLVQLIQKWGNLDEEYRKDVLSLFEPHPDARLLDLGCGDGEFTLRVAEKIGTKRVFGVEMIKDSVDKAAASGIKCYQADFDRAHFPFEDETFDVVCANQVIEHLSDTDTFVKEIYRVLKPGGYAVVSTTNLAAFHAVFLLLMGFQPYAANVSSEAPWAGTFYPARGRRSPPEMAHRRIFTLRALRELLQYHGLKAQRSTGSHFFPFPAPLGRLACMVDKRHATRISIKAKKS
jgi:ubiquinone/menaquinone biosynthesis C-methylase UbiE